MAGGVRGCSNLSLALNRFLDAWRPDGRPGHPPIKIDEGLRRGFLNACTSIVGGHPARAILSDYHARHDALLTSYRADGRQILDVTARLRRRLVIGLGIAHPLETNLALHRIGGFPYVPGSSVKGACRAAATELDGPDNPLVAWAFGPAHDINAHARGGLAFLDALPLADASYKLAVDVMTPHHSGYYTRREEPEPPADWQSPTPILFLTVNADTLFRFAVVARSEDVDRAAMSSLNDWLAEALRDGLGGKRSAGYGTFEMVR